MTIRTLRTSIEKVDLDACIKEFGGSRYNLILASTVRAREIAYQRLLAAKGGGNIAYESKPAVEALCEIAAGKIDKSYLKKVK